jgi:hypothetical protein
MEKQTYTYTDTFGDEPNFAWARSVEAKDIREAKRLLDLSGIRFRYVGCGRWDNNGTTCILSESGER